MFDPDSYLPGESPELEFIYNNEGDFQPTYWPIFYSQYEYKKDARALYNDSQDDYITYSGGWNTLFVTKQKDGRYKNISLRAYSGDSFYFYLSAGSLSDGVPTYYSGPLTTSGSYSVLTKYSGEQNAIDNKVLFTAPTDNSVVYTFPEVSVVNFMRLHHYEAVSGEDYRLYQFLPRTLIQVDDLEADVIDAVTIRVSDSIVIGPDMIGDKTLLGRKIVDGTISGILMTDGTITGSKIVANTISGALITAGAITADKLSVTNLQAVSANTGNLSVNGNLTVTSGQLSAGTSTIDSQGIRIGTINSALSETNALRIYGSGSANNVVGMAFYNGQFNPTTPLFQVNLDGSNAIEFENNQPSNGVINFNFPATATSTSVQVFNGDFNLRRSNDSTAAVAPSVVGYNKSSQVRYQLTDTMVSGISLFGSSAASAPSIRAINSTGATVNLMSNAELNISTIAYFLANAEAVGGGQFIVRDNSDNIRVQASQTTLSTRSTTGLTFTVDTATGDTRIYRDFRVDGNFLQFNYGSMTKNAAQTVNAGVTAKITFQVAGNNGALDDLTNNQINIVDAGLYLIVAGVVSTTVGLPWQVVTGGAYNSGVLLNGVTQADGRAYSSKMLYLNPGELELWLSNTGGSNAAISIGNNGAVLSATKVG